MSQKKPKLSFSFLAHNLLAKKKGGEAEAEGDTSAPRVGIFCLYPYRVLCMFLAKLLGVSNSNLKIDKLEIKINSQENLVCIANIGRVIAKTRENIFIQLSPTNNQILARICVWYIIDRQNEWNVFQIYHTFFLCSP